MWLALAFVILWVTAATFAVAWRIECGAHDRTKADSEAMHQLLPACSCGQFIPAHIHAVEIRFEGWAHTQQTCHPLAEAL